MKILTLDGGFIDSNHDDDYHKLYEMDDYENEFQLTIKEAISKLKEMI
jgi:hypothetical protein